MGHLSAAERALVDELLDCIAEAMRRQDDVDPAYASKTKLQKLLYLAIDEFDLPVTHSWYLAGAVVPGDGATPAGLRSSFDDVTGPSGPSLDADESAAPSDTDSAAAATDGFDDLLDSVASPADDETLDPILFSPESAGETDPSPDRLGDRRADVVDFYEATLPDVWYQRTMRFLQNFYLEHAPAAYRDLYVQSTHLRTRLHDVETVVKAITEGEQPTQSLDELVDDVGLDISDLHCSIQSSEELQSTFDGFVRGTDLIEDGLLMLATRSPDDLEPGHVATVQSMQDFFFYYVWRFPCLHISRETATGPSVESLRAERTDRLADFEDELQQEADRFERELAQAGLIPDYTDYSPPDDDVTETITSLADNYIE
ncbi:hypothetical protein SAMN05216559_1747 [Halomicrobium zhouii]|uniref:DUF8098 domain-containing protein n=1 Tax=Halomicrobium zhouii TaxID=767519 RepID=A0A1I6L0I6_9EURY|nr:hypothetical protein [Halomicrobium zhouii]SFR96964.1 hypothetical protein SAMN05216559_1747 [Halomicrobium zhouii]